MKETNKKKKKYNHPELRKFGKVEQITFGGGSVLPLDATLTKRPS